MFQLGSFGNVDGHLWGHYAWADLPVSESSMNRVGVEVPFVPELANPHNQNHTHISLDQH